MGTRSLVIFKRENKKFYQYNQYDGYPSAMGKEVCDFIRTFEPNLLGIFGRLKQVNGVSGIPDLLDIQHCEEMGACDLSVSTRSKEDWYCLVRGAQHNLELYAKGLKFIHGSKKEKDDIFIEYQYIIDIGKERLTVKNYTGKKIFDESFSYIFNNSTDTLVTIMQDAEKEGEDE
jgi:hypothetical protein